MIIQAGVNGAHVLAEAQHDAEFFRLHAEESGQSPDRQRTDQDQCDAHAAEMAARQKLLQLVLAAPQEVLQIGWPRSDRLRPAGQNDTFGCGHARALLQTALGIIDKDMARKTWAAGEAFTMADCAAAPSLFYYNMVVTPLAGSFDNVAAYLDRLVKRPSYARALKEAEPFLKYVPM